MKKMLRKAITAAVTVLSAGLFLLSGPLEPSPYPMEPPEVESGEDSGCKPLNDQPGKDYDRKVLDESTP